ncbi:MAG TPA: hypothetical protein VKA46_36810 [Gemmataceae bacterium]|nr:hypothetical protein [Gemmataceae bacterium]
MQAIGGLAAINLSLLPQIQALVTTATASKFFDPAIFAARVINLIGESAVATRVLLLAHLSVFAYLGGAILGVYLAGKVFGIDPPVSAELSNEAIALPTPTNISQNTTARTGSVTAGTAGGSVTVPSTTASGQLSARWRSASTGDFQVATFSATAATVTDSTGTTVGTGVASLTAASPIPAAVMGNNSYSINGTGSLSFYGPAESSLGAGGNWTNYSATVTGNTSITLTTDGLTLNGRALPAGTYTITTRSATLGGSGQSTSPNFSGSASLSVTGGTVTLGPENGSIILGGKALDLSNGATLDGYTGNLSVAAGGGNNTDTVTLNGNAANVLTVSATPATLTTDQNTPKTFQVNVNTSLADTYNLTAQAPPGWTVSLNATGRVAVTPAPGLQGGTFPIQVIAQSQTDLNLVAQTTVNVTVTPTTPGETLTVIGDPLLTVPFNNAQLPTAFQVQIHNNGPAPITEDLAFSNVPSGFTLLNSGTSVTIPAGQTGIVGVYLQPTSGQVPPVGTPASFTVTATNAANPADMQTFNESFTIPAVDGITLSSNPVQVNTLPGVTGTATLTVTNVGNVSETVTLSSSSSAGLTVSGLQTVTVPAGQSSTETVSCTPSAQTPLNTTLQTTITATFGPANAPLTQTLEIPVDAVIVGAQAVASAAVSAGQIGEGNLGAQLGDLSTDLTNLEPNTANAIFNSQVLADLAAVAALLPADPFLAKFAAGVAAGRGEIANAVTASNFQTAFNDLANTMSSISSVLSEQAASGFSLSLSPNSALALPTTPSQVVLLLGNNGNATTTYDISISGLPANVTAAFAPKVTMLPDQILGGVSQASIPITLTETGGSLFPTSFTVTVTPEGAPDIAQSVTGTLTVRPTFVDVTQVVVNPTLAKQGTPVDVVARLLNSINQQQQALASYTVTDSGGHVVFTSTAVPLTLNVVSLLSSVDLGSFPTTGLANGVYTATVTITDLSGHLLPGGTNQGTVLVGTPVSATLTTAPTTLAPGTGTVTTTLQVNAIAGAANSATVTVPTNNGVAIVPGSFNIAPTTITPHNNGTEDLTWNFSTLPAGTLFFTGAGGSLIGIDKLDLATGTITNVFTTSVALDGALTFDNSGDIIYASNDNEMDLYNPATNTSTPVATGFSFANTLTLEPGGNSVLVGNHGAVDRVNLSTGVVTQLFSLATFGPNFIGFRPTGIAYDNQGNLFVAGFLVSNSRSGFTGDAVWQVDPTTGAILQTIPLPGLSEDTQGVTFDPVTGALWVTFAPNGLIEVSNYLTHPQLQVFTSPQFSNFTGIQSDGRGNLYIGSALGPLIEYNIAGNTYTNVTPTYALTAGGIAPLIGLGAPPSSQTFTWQSTVSNLQSGEARDVTLGGIVNFTNQGSPATLSLPPTVVTGAQILALSPASQTVAPESPAAYTVTVSNPTSTADTFNLAVLGVPASWVSLPPSITVAANTSVPVTLTLTSDALATLGDHGFTVTAKDANGVSAFVHGDLILAGQPPAAPDIEAHGVVVSLKPVQASAGQGTTARFTVQVTNTGSVADTFSLAALGLSAGITVLFSPAMVLVEPGTKSVQTVILTLTPARGTTAGAIPFQVTATSTTASTVTASAQATLTVVKQGVQVSLSPASGAPGSTFMLTVTNTGTVKDTFDLSLGGPAALVAHLAQVKVTLAAGASTTVKITTQPVKFAVPGALTLVGIAKSEGNPAIQASATASITVAGTQGMTAQFSPGVQVIQVPGTSNFLLLVNNTGNSEDAYTATIKGTSGPVTGQLMGLNGQPTHTIPTFRLPGLSTGALLLETDLAAFATGTITIEIDSLTDPAIKATVKATVKATPPPPPPPPHRGRGFG